LFGYLNFVQFGIYLVDFFSKALYYVEGTTEHFLLFLGTISMIETTLANLAQQLELPAPSHDVSFCGISIDTRTLQPGNLFVAICGSQFDGHTFVTEAAKKGAAAILVNHPVDHPIPQLHVADTLLTLGKIAANWRDQFSLPLIGVTGSSGKTTLKNMIAAILRAACHNQVDQVLATEGNFNNNIGLPLNLVRLNTEQRYAVLEMGMNHFGEIEYLTQLAKPSVAVINNAAAAHLEGVKDLAGVAKAKGEIFLGLDPQGTAILNRDDAYFNYWQSLIGTRKLISFGLEHAADVTAHYETNQPITIKTPRGEFTVTVPLLGKHNVMNALAATAAALALNIELADIKAGLENVKPAPGRMRQYELANQVKVIDDTYNANPFSLQAAVNTLAAFSGTRILVVGDMKELGENAEEIHFTMGQKIRAAGIDYLFTFGNLSAATTKGFGQNAQHFTERDLLIQTLLPYLKNDVTVLVKGSRSMQMEKIIAGIIPKTQLEHAH
jgi:UDP-N-acetylmuramoyl-tripeptide--D-alanyl-D-alanine ligase